jgi:hypothetical protein
MGESPDLFESQASADENGAARVGDPLDELAAATDGGTPDTLDSFGRTETMLEFWAALGEAGIPPPPVPAEVRPAVIPRGNWHWGTFDIDPLDLFVLRPFVEWTVLQWDRKPAFLFGRYDSIASSTLLTLFVARGPVAVLAQHSWREPDADPMAGAADVAATYEASRLFLETVTHLEGPARLLLHVASAQDVFTLLDLPLPSEYFLPEPAEMVQHAPRRYDCLDALFQAASEFIEP